MTFDCVYPIIQLWLVTVDCVYQIIVSHVLIVGFVAFAHWRPRACWPAQSRAVRGRFFTLDFELSFDCFGVCFLGG